MKSSRLIIVTAAAAILILYAIGGLLGDIDSQCTEIGGCRACWRTVPANVTSELCPGSNGTRNGSCIAEPFAMQNNAIVDAITCACDKAEAGGNYPDDKLNKKIEEVFSTFTGTQAKVQDVCGLNSPLVKRQYG